MLRIFRALAASQNFHLIGGAKTLLDSYQKEAANMLEFVGGPSEFPGFALEGNPTR